jgi:hypothetical protein
MQSYLKQNILEGVKMSSDAMTHALENGEGSADPRNYKTRLWEEWFETTKNCKFKKRDKQRLCKICKVDNNICVYRTCFLRFTQTIRL